MEQIRAFKVCRRANHHQEMFDTLKLSKWDALTISAEQMPPHGYGVTDMHLAFSQFWFMIHEERVYVIVKKLELG